MDYLAVIKDFGLIGLFTLFFIKEVWPQAFSIFSRSYKAKMEREARLQERQISVDERIATNLERQGNILAGMQQQLAALNGATNSLTSHVIAYTGDVRETLGWLSSQAGGDPPELSDLPDQD